MSDESILDAYRVKIAQFEKARREVEKVRKEAIDDLLRQRREVNAHLRALGYEGDQQDAPRRSIAVVPDAPIQSAAVHVEPAVTGLPMENGHKRRRFKGAKTFDIAFCSICELRGHDLRAHRGQGHKRAFSAVELRARGLAAEVSDSRSVSN